MWAKWKKGPPRSSSWSFQVEYTHLVIFVKNLVKNTHSLSPCYAPVHTLGTAITVQHGRRLLFFIWTPKKCQEWYVYLTIAHYGYEYECVWRAVLCEGEILSMWGLWTNRSCVKGNTKYFSTSGSDHTALVWTKCKIYWGGFIGTASEPFPRRFHYGGTASIPQRTTGDRSGTVPEPLPCIWNRLEISHRFRTGLVCNGGLSGRKMRAVRVRPV